MISQSEFNLFPLLNNVGKLVYYLNLKSRESGFRTVINKTRVAEVLNIPRRTFFRVFDEAVESGLIFKVIPTEKEIKDMMVWQAGNNSMILNENTIKKEFVWVEVKDLNSISLQDMGENL